ncbi:hypothetical protein AXG93_745s1190 [Marchantia polymorpha subsp. ruderalis]|uniref:Uncharacterized protein n=1 Tax=Marchantia polymorpha subsp. ruderalis TaxID=1480154 RepID=A0A176VRJ6_MARPO|nr:hypothetical protein AXG93_745s1190 [Marchantia polymorpha subsp. ruderalis]
MLRCSFLVEEERPWCSVAHEILNFQSEVEPVHDTGANALPTNAYVKLRRRSASDEKRNLVPNLNVAVGELDGFLEREAVDRGLWTKTVDSAARRERRGS